MNATLQTFRAGAAELKRFLDSSEKQEELLRLLMREERRKQLKPDEEALLGAVSRTATDRRRYIYAVAIVSLYGLLERYVDGIIADYLAHLSQLVPSFAALPEAIRRNHFDLSIELARLVADERYRLEINKEEIIANLYGCISGAAPFKVNGAAFVIHRGNVTLQRIGEFLTKLGVSPHLPKVIRSGSMRGYLRERDPDRDYSQISDDDLKAILGPIDDLVERRNEISHGVVNIDDIESIDLLKERCRFVDAYGRSLYEILMQEVIDREIKLPHATTLGRAIKVIKRSIVCFEKDQCTLRLGDILVAKTSDSLMPFRFAPIESIQIEGVDHEAIALARSTRFAVKAALRARDNFDYVVLPGTVA